MRTALDKQVDIVQTKIEQKRYADILQVHKYGIAKIVNVKSRF
jgi:hypothetical protein